jgi:hypothetical protein
MVQLLDVYYSNGHLLWKYVDGSGPRAFAVWQLEYDLAAPKSSAQRISGIHYRHRIHLGGQRNGDYVVAENGKLYELRHVFPANHRGPGLDEDDIGDDFQGPYQNIVVHDIASGQHIQTIPCNNIPGTCQFIMSTATHLLLVRLLDSSRLDAGIFTFDMENEQSQTTFLYFGEHGIRGDTITDGPPFKGGYPYKDGTGSCRMVWSDDRGILRRHEAVIPLREQDYVAYMGSASRVFFISASYLPPFDDHGKIEEFDLRLARKCGLCRLALHSLATVAFAMFFSNDAAVFCIIQSAPHNHLVIQSFLL